MPRQRPATTPEEVEEIMISAAVQLAQKQLEDGTASAQVITHYLKLGSSRERLEQERLRGENELLAARAEQIASQQRVEEMYANALAAMRTYSGQSYDEELPEETEGYYE